MGRRRIATEAEAFRVMDRMTADGRGVSVRAVRAALGGGSSRTVAAYVRAWRQHRDRGKALETVAPGAVGEAVAQLVTAAWRSVENIHRIDCGQREAEAQRELDELRDRADALERDKAALAHEITALQAENRVLREQLKRNDQ